MIAGADDGTRTRNRRFTKPLLYQLSYVGAAQGHTAVDPVAPANDMAAGPDGSSEARRTGRPAVSPVHGQQRLVPTVAVRVRLPGVIGRE